MYHHIRSFFPYLITYRKEITVGAIALILTDLVALAIPWILKNFIDLLSERPAGSELLFYALILCLVSLFQALFRFGWRKFLFGPSRKVEFDILNHLMQHFFNLDATYYQKEKTGDLMSRATNDLRSIRDFVGLGLLIFVDSSLVIFCCLSLMSLLNPTLTLYCLVPLPIVSILFFKFSRSISKKQREVQEHLARISSRVQENLSGIRVLHAFVQENNEMRKFATLNEEYVKKNLQLTKLFALFTPSLVFTLGVSALIALWQGAHQVISGTMTLGDFVAFNGYLIMLSWPMMGIGFVFNLTQRGLSAMARLDEVFSSMPSIIDTAKKTGSAIKGEITFENLGFSYPEASGLALKNINCVIPKGGRLVIMGKIGSGKTSLLCLIPRLFNFNTGSLKIDGIPVSEIPLSVLRKSVGYVGQEPFMFSATIRENLKLGNALATDADIQEVIVMSGLQPDMERFPQGLDTLVGERGVSLSGGQKQRLALARALLRKPEILILDDAFSSLDVETEEWIVSQINQKIRGITTLIATHRVTGVKEAGQILVLDQGTVVELGTHAELMQNQGFYSRLYKEQMLTREMDFFLQ